VSFAMPSRCQKTVVGGNGSRASGRAAGNDRRRGRGRNTPALDMGELG